MKIPNILYVGVDSEYVAPIISDTSFAAKFDGLLGRKNDIVCYSCYGIYGNTRWEWIAMMPKGKRMKFAEIIGAILCEGKKQGAYTRWPKAMNLAIHWSLADFSAVGDLEDIQHHFDSHRKGFVTFETPYRLICYPSVRNKVVIDINLYDTLLLAPEGNRQLKAIENLLGVQKLHVSDDEIENARLFSEQSPERFRAYAIQDARIAAEYLLKLRSIFGTILSEPRLPKTLSSVAESFALEHWVAAGVDVETLLGCEEAIVEGKKKLRRTMKYRLSLPIATDAFRGGFAVASTFGPSGSGEWSDWDISSAYLTALSALGFPVWEEMRPATSIADFTPDVIGAALVRFSFPPSTKFPCIPVWIEENGNLIFPLQGEGLASAPEIQLAARLGARMELVEDTSFILPMRMGNRPFATLASVLSQERATLRKRGKQDGLEDTIYKTIAAALYGKLAQASREKKVFDSRSGTLKLMPESCLTNPYFAGAVTGLIRAALLEILNALPPQRQVLSATTDGFLSNATPGEVFKATQGPLGSVLRDATGFGEESSHVPHSILKLKHTAKEVIVWATRGQCTAEYAGDPKEKKFLVLAKGNVMCPFRHAWEQNEHLVEKFLARRFGEKTPVTQFRGLREIWESRGEADLNLKKKHVSYRMDFDWRRVPINASMRTVRGVDHLWFDTAPLASARHFEVLRKGWADFRKVGKRVLKTEQDLKDFNSFLSIVPHKKRPRKKIEAVVDIISRMFLRAYRKRMWGLDGALGDKALAEVLTGIGFTVPVSKVENAGREKTPRPVPCLYHTPEVAAWLTKLKQAFPEFNEHAMIVSTSPPWSYSNEFHDSLPEAAFEEFPFGE